MYPSYLRLIFESPVEGCPIVRLNTNPEEDHVNTLLLATNTINCHLPVIAIGG